MQRAEPLRFAVLALMIELGCLLLPCLIFLILYLQTFHAPATAALRHLELVLPATLLLMLIRGSAVGTLGKPWGARVGAVLYALWFLWWLSYYGTVLVGLQNWGRVATWPLIKVYVLHWRDLLDVLDIPWALVLVAGCALGAATGFLGWILTRRDLWIHRYHARVGAVVRAAALLLVVAVLLLRMHQVADATHMGSDEPVMLSLNPWAGTRQGQTNRTEGARVIDEREARAAAAYQPGVRTHSRNVILIVGDALRSERMSLFGHERATTPYLSALHQTGAMQLAAQGHSICAESYCGLMALVRSKYLHEFSTHSLSLAQVLRRHGYAVYLLLGGDHTNFYGLAEALGPADLYWDGLQSGEYMNDDRAVLARARELPAAGEQPVMMQFHLMSSHGLGSRQPEFQEFSPIANYYRRGRLSANAEELKSWAGNFYDNGILQFDHTVHELLAVLREKGYLDDAVVVITGDHGELLGERGKYSHADTVLQAVLDIPILLARFGYAGEDFESKRFASQVDVAPTILLELGLPIPQSWAGEPLQHPMQRGFSFFQQGEEVGLYDLRSPDSVWKYWRDLAAGTEHAYRLDQDPREEHDLGSDVPSTLRKEWLLQLLPSTTSASGAALPMEEKAEEHTSKD